MAGTNLSIEIDDKAALAMLVQLGQAGTGDLMSRVGEYLERTTKDRFATQTAPDGTPWQALEERYRKRKKYNADKVLTLNTYLGKGIRYQVEGPYAVLVGSDRPYAAIHQFGGTIKMPARDATVRLHSVNGRLRFAKKSNTDATEKTVSIGAHEVNMPARPYLGVSAEDHAEVNAIVSDWIRTQTQG